MKYKLGDLIEQVNIKCGFLNYPNISGINILKQFMPSKNVGTDTSKYLRVPFGHFACNLMHVGRDEKIPMALNLSKEDVVVSNAYFIFKVIDEIHLMKEYLNILFTSPEFDRYAWFATDASVRGNLDWDRFCEIEIDLPPLEIQEKYVTVYNGLLANQKAYENGLEDLKLVCDSTIEKLKQEMIPTKLVNLIEITENKNTNLEYNLESVRGISNGKEFIPTKAKMDGVSLSPYLIISSNEFAFVSVTSRNGEKISIAHNDNSENYLCSSSYISFKVSDANVLEPRFLNMFFKRSEFDRYARYNSWGSARETFNWEDMQDIEIPLPKLSVQKSIVEIYNAYITRKEINEKLKQQIKDICPILISGAVKEAKAHAKI